MNKHNNNALSMCKYILDSMIYRQKFLGEEENLKNKLALIEEYREWITEGIFESNALYLIDKRWLIFRNQIMNNPKSQLIKTLVLSINYSLKKKK